MHCDRDSHQCHQHMALVRVPIAVHAVSHATPHLLDTHACLLSNQRGSDQCHRGFCDQCFHCQKCCATPPHVVQASVFVSDFKTCQSRGSQKRHPLPLVKTPRRAEISAPTWSDLTVKKPGTVKNGQRPKAKDGQTPRGSFSNTV